MFCHDVAHLKKYLLGFNMADQSSAIYQFSESGPEKRDLIIYMNQIMMNGVILRFLSSFLCSGTDKVSI